MRHSKTVLVAALVASVGLVSLLNAGDLNPPAGPVAATMKPLDQIEPRTAVTGATTPGTSTALFRITQPGSYYLVGNIAGVAGKSGVEIAASDVTLDLAGFRMQGVAGSLAGVSITSGQANIAVRKGPSAAGPRAASRGARRSSARPRASARSATRGRGSSWAPGRT